jgi:hypothetical protein
VDLHSDFDPGGGGAGGSGVDWGATGGGSRGETDEGGGDGSPGFELADGGIF